VADKGTLIRLPVHVLERQMKVQATSERMLRQLGRRPTIEELAEELALTPEQVEQALAAASVARSLNEPVDDDGSELGDLVGDEDAGEEFDEVERRIDASRLLASALHQLPARERHVVTRHYTSEPATLSELSRDLGVCHQRVAQLEDRALSELRKIVAR
jgi:DNA-directed RNA polymerase sigma subunit (sigma70/sigma32)